MRYLKKILKEYAKFVNKNKKLPMIVQLTPKVYLKMLQRLNKVTDISDIERLQAFIDLRGERLFLIEISNNIKDIKLIGGKYE